MAGLTHAVFTDMRTTVIGLAAVAVAWGRAAFIVCIAVLTVACRPATDDAANALQPFSSDGCSLFPDSAAKTSLDWCDCCFQHDIAYWRGGTEAERQHADKQLQTCVENKTGNGALAALMYEGVRVGGSPYFPTWYRWGYGWEENRGYQSLTDAQLKQADNLMSAYESAGSASVCTAQ